MFVMIHLDQHGDFIRHQLFWTQGDVASYFTGERNTIIHSTPEREEQLIEDYKQLLNTDYSNACCTLYIGEKAGLYIFREIKTFRETLRVKS